MADLLYALLSEIESSIGSYHGIEESDFLRYVQWAQNEGFDYFSRKEEERRKNMESAVNQKADRDPVVKKLPDPNY